MDAPHEGGFEKGEKGGESFALSPIPRRRFLFAIKREGSW